MAGETIKTKGVVLSIHPWSRTSHVVTWLTFDCGVVTTIVKGALRPKSAFLGQYDLFYTCELIYYARSKSSVHAIREVSPLEMREFLRENWRANLLAGYAGDMIRDLVPSGDESKKWYAFFVSFLDSLRAVESFPLAMVQLEKKILSLAGLEPDFSDMDMSAPWSSFSIECGKCCERGRVMRITPEMVMGMSSPTKASKDTLFSLIRFMGVFISFHLDRPPDIRRSVVQLILS
ncbi:MAG: DNA repair protein RecO [Kiritimatiellae bacterium]|nr:DNA repair protein RecO [Kiritimatiellia bacterium]